MLNKRKRAIAGNLVIMVFVMFFFALFSLLSLYMWDQAETAFNNMDNDTVSETVKLKITEYRVKMTFGNKLFVFLFICLLIAYLISAITTPIESPYYMIVFAVVILLTTILSMIFANTWNYIIENPNFITAAADMGFITYFMRYYPIYTFFIGIIGAILYFSRKETTFNENIGGGLIE